MFNLPTHLLGTGRVIQRLINLSDDGYPDLPSHLTPTGVPGV
jgi:hypothetical protein